ncbi:MAG: CAP domain-containing protein [Treponema sp.]|nr:CAP domain-containing protein [Treponema sp.]
MRNKILKIIAIAAILATTLGCDFLYNLANGYDGDDSGSKNGTPKDELGEVQAVTGDKEIDTLFKLTNDFRTGSEASYVKKDDTTKTNLVGKLGELTLDKDLCEAAAIRAKEIVQDFSHTRPNGSGCFTVLDELGIKAGAKAENIAAGNKSGEKTFNQWKEDNKPYSGQGHRRNMLSTSATKIGLAYAYDPNSTYKYYWVMILTN